jgi:hypothetical protein
MKTARFLMHAALFATLALGACRTTTTSRSPAPDQPFIAHGTAAKAWDVRDDGRLLGSLVRYDMQSDVRQGYYSVRNRDGQELGLVDLEGRAWRYRPHEREAEWLGTGTVLEGARRILSGSWATALEETDLATLSVPH